MLGRGRREAGQQVTEALKKVARDRSSHLSDTVREGLAQQAARKSAKPKKAQKGRGGGGPRRSG